LIKGVEDVKTKKDKKDKKNIEVRNRVSSLSKEDGNSFMESLSRVAS